MYLHEEEKQERSELGEALIHSPRNILEPDP